ncbi:hypothetical protein ATY41_10410 [Leifsonia xyli subsp. xyli]|uniref:DUF4870 domain-containing protein n=2 Tax=Leifsonia xyli subsp. xyli TaxID=59736 RepID=Q6AEB8_LEIXX|nr:DUF4870 domain-containing protein [Leifsonia xyli]AAT89278.1 conserved hypothetical protein [Leifsonia xyli subsp. xyli str. CTCB07]ODA90309.1 hypothetical protein ATY41_10410 [Leifsonia xyli subsp. xyli]
MSATPPPPQQPYGGSSQHLSPADEKLWATLVHVGGILFNWIPALVGYLVLKDRGPFVRAHTTTALNFQITLFIGYLLGWITSFVGVGLIVLFAVWVVNIVLSVIAAMKANQGADYTYPMAIKFVS